VPKAIGVRVANKILSLNPRQRIVIATPDAQDATKLSDGANTLIKILEKPFSNEKLEPCVLVVPSFLTDRISNKMGYLDPL